jgi:hypothetical protein
VDCLRISLGNFGDWNMMSSEEMESKRKVDGTNDSESGDDSLITKSEIRMLSSAEVMTVVKRVAELEPESGSRPPCGF